MCGGNPMSGNPNVSMPVIKQFRGGNERFALWAIIGTLLFLHIVTLMRFPGPFVDEIWAINRAWSFLQTGRQFGDLDSGVFDSSPSHRTIELSASWRPDRIFGALRFAAIPSSRSTSAQRRFPPARERSAKRLSTPANPFQRTWPLRDSAEPLAA